MSHDAPAADAAHEDTMRLGMGIFLVSLGVLFAAALVGCVIVWARLPGWTAEPRFNDAHGLLLSTGFLVVLSVCVQGTLGAARRGDRRRLAALLWISFGLAWLFLGNQVLLWRDLMAWRTAAAAVQPGRDLQVFIFFVLVFLHALHVAGGLVAHTLALVKVRRADTFPRARLGTLKGLIAYWHFLGVAWLAIYGVILLMLP